MFSLCAQRDLKCSSPVTGSWRGGGGGGLLELLKLPHANVEEVELQQRSFVRSFVHASNLHFQPVIAQTVKKAFSPTISGCSPFQMNVPTLQDRNMHVSQQFVFAPNGVLKNGMRSA